MFHTVLVANRGEIARRIIKTLRLMGIRSVAVYSDADTDAPFVREADEAVRIGPAPASQSYLNGDAVLAAAAQTGAEAIHPGYGFLSENAGFAGACEAAGIVFIGPGVDALSIMADKISAKAHVAANGVPVVPGFSAAGLTDAEIVSQAHDVGYPILVKPSAGGGGKGMEVVRSPADLAQAIATARRVALAAFGDDTLLLERLLENPRHIEVQILGDNAGTIVHLGERECTLQRRHQKVIEESPSVLIDADTRARIGAAAIEAARSVAYRGAGTVEFLFAGDNTAEFFFIEMNTRLQVEHPVTEEVTGVDVVEQQIRIAAGEPLSFGQDGVSLSGHAIEARVYAETPSRGFLPATGDILAWQTPADVRVDAAIAEGSIVGDDYDPMLAKVIAHGASREGALDALILALQQTVILGVDTNVEFLISLLRREDVREGRLDTALLDRIGIPEQSPAHDDVVRAAAEYCASTTVPDSLRSSPWATEAGWRAGGRRVAVTYSFVTDEDRILSSAADRVLDATVRPDDEGAVWVHAAGQTRRLRPLTREAAALRRLDAIERSSHPITPEAVSPMPGNVVAIHVADGEVVRAGDRLVTIEAMKMEHSVFAAASGTVTLRVAVGDHVSRDQVVASLEQKDADA